MWKPTERERTLKEEPNWTPEERGEKVAWEERERRGKRASRNLFHLPMSGPFGRIQRVFRIFFIEDIRMFAYP